MTMLATSSAVGVGLIVVYLAVVVFELAALWRVFVKAGRPGWAAIVPIYSTYVLLKLVGRSGWWMLLLVVPVVNVVSLAIVMYDLARSFRRGGGFAVGLFFLSFVFIPILGYGQSRYDGAAAR